LSCALTVSEDGSPKIAGTLAVATDVECYFACLLVKSSYSCPQYDYTSEPKWTRYHHGQVNLEEFRHFIDSHLPFHMFRPRGGTFASVEELRAAFEARFATGAKWVPNPLRDPCEGWSDDTGCPGHDILVGADPT